jgi:hypothetical protein
VDDDLGFAPAGEEHGHPDNGARSSPDPRGRGRVGSEAELSFRRRGAGEDERSEEGHSLGHAE